MRPLAPPPRVIVDPETRLPAFGSYRGDLPEVDLRPLGMGPLFAFAHEKRWVYVTIAAGELLLGFIILRLGYAANHFAFAFDRAEGRMLVEHTSLTLPLLCKVADRAGAGCSARYHQPLERTRAKLSRGIGASAYVVALRSPELTLDARLETASAPPPIGAVASVGGPTLVQVTAKHALLSVSGTAIIDGKRRSLDGGLAGVDYSHGYLPRRTQWRWAFVHGRARSGERVGVNLVQGFVGEPECAVWIDDALYPVGEGRISFNEARPLDPWEVRSSDGAVDLRFEPGALHAEHRDLLVVSSDYVQPVGSFSGSIEVPGRGRIELERALGVVEDQHVVW